MAKLLLFLAATPTLVTGKCCVTYSLKTGFATTWHGLFKQDCPPNEATYPKADKETCDELKKQCPVNCVQHVCEPEKLDKCMPMPELFVQWRFEDDSDKRCVAETCPFSGEILQYVKENPKFYEEAFKQDKEGDWIPISKEAINTQKTEGENQKNGAWEQMEALLKAEKEKKAADLENALTGARRWRDRALQQVNKYKKPREFGFCGIKKIKKKEGCRVDGNPVTMDKSLKQMQTLGLFPSSFTFNAHMVEAPKTRDDIENELVERVWKGMVDACATDATCRQAREDKIFELVEKSECPFTEKFVAQAWTESKTTIQRVTDELPKILDSGKQPLLLCDFEEGTPSLNETVKKNNLRLCNYKWIGKATEIVEKMQNSWICELLELNADIALKSLVDVEAKPCQKTVPCNHGKTACKYCDQLKKQLIKEFIVSEKVWAAWGDNGDKTWSELLEEATPEKEQARTAKFAKRFLKAIGDLNEQIKKEEKTKDKGLIQFDKIIDEIVQRTFEAKKTTARRSLLRLLRRVIRRTLASQ